MLNKVFLQGRLVADPELRHTQQGTPVASYRLAVDRDYKSKDSNAQNADFVNIVSWRNTAEFVSRYFTKGRMMLVEGRLQMRDYTDRDGNKRVAAEIVTDSLQTPAKMMADQILALITVLPAMTASQS